MAQAGSGLFGVVDRFLKWRRPRSRRSRSLFVKESRVLDGHASDDGSDGWRDSDGETDLGILAIRSSSSFNLEMGSSPPGGYFPSLVLGLHCSKL